MEAMRDEQLDPRPWTRMTLPVRRDVLVDLAMFRAISVIARRPTQAAVVSRIGGEVNDALALFDERGWIAEPASYHRDPPQPEGVRARWSRRSAVRLATITWDDGFECRPEEPGAARYAGYARNRIARAMLVEHQSGDRPWVVCLHGFGMGSTGVDLRTFRVGHLHHDLGLNVAFLTLPFHGRRRLDRRGLPAFPGIDILDNLHGLAQSVWDVRQLLRLLRARTKQPIGLLGLSLGGCVTSLVASLDDIDAALLLVPMVDLATLMHDAAVQYGSRMGVNGEVAALSRPLLNPVSPLALTPRLPVDRRVIIAGTLDRFVPASAHAVPLWRHWDQPEIHWYHGGHVSVFWSPTARAGLDASLHRLGMIGETK
jgi:pimeloyl-ACP methyl ester carboxylesterase